MLYPILNRSHLFTFIIILIIGQSPTTSVLAGCLNAKGLPMCCQGRQSACSSFINSNQRNASRSSVHGRSHYLGLLLTKSLQEEICFCDEHCMKTKDCCPDYRQLCDKPVVDCSVSDWGPWTQCDRQCGRGVSLRRRRIVQAASNGGEHCPVLEESKPCEGQKCGFKRVGRSSFLTRSYMKQARSEVAYLLPTRGDVRAMTRRWHIRWDVRRKLYLGRLLKQNKTEPVDPAPYCAVYQITNINPACKTQTMLWEMKRKKMGSSYLQPQSSHYYNTYSNLPHDIYSFNRNPYLNRRRRSTPYETYGYPIDQYSSPDQMSDLTWSQTWFYHIGLLTENQQICVACYPGMMREESNARCTGTGMLNVETRWRALGTLDCHGRFRMVQLPERDCTCGSNFASFNFA